MQDLTKVVVDTCVLLDDPDVLVRIRQKGGLAFLTSTVLDELDFNKSGRSAVGLNARMIFREFKQEAPIKLSAMPTGEALHGQDLLTQFSFRNGSVYLIARDEFRSRSNNDAKIIELAKDYGMVLITRDNGMKIRAEVLGVNVAFWTGPEESSATSQPQNKKPHQPGRRPMQSAAATHLTPNSIKPFAVYQAPINEPDTPISVTSIPGSGGAAQLSSGAVFHLGRQISAGGEGIIYETDLAGQVCKIYHQNRLTLLKQKKIKLMASRQIDRPGICWPTEIVTNTAGEFVGYIMSRAHGQTMQSTMFIKPKLEKIFPNWTRLDLVNIAGTFIDHIKFLHQNNIIVGDINPMNLLIAENSEEVWMVDTDSFQIENFPCPVGTVNFTPNEIQGRNYSEFLRTIDHELFAVATMIFMILFPGKPPYSQQGGGSPAENIKSKNFPYRFYKDSGQSAPEVSGKDAPQGSWQYIWSHLPNSIREAFFSTFREDKRTSIDEWTNLLVGYRNLLQREKSSDEIFPLGFPVRDPTQISCAKCSTTFIASQRYIDKLSAEGKSVWCQTCAARARLEKLARQSKKVTEQVTSKPTIQNNHSTGPKPVRPAPRPSVSPRTSPYPHNRPQQSATPSPPPNQSQQTSRSPNRNISAGSIISNIFRAIFKQ